MKLFLYNILPCLLEQNRLNIKCSFLVRLESHYFLPFATVMGYTLDKTLKHHTAEDAVYLVTSVMHATDSNSHLGPPSPGHYLQYWRGSLAWGFVKRIQGLIENDRITV